MVAEGGGMGFENEWSVRLSPPCIERCMMCMNQSATDASYRLILSFISGHDVTQANALSNEVYRLSFNPNCHRLVPR
jgi:hypothetical protein